MRRIVVAVLLVTAVLTGGAAAALTFGLLPDGTQDLNNASTSADL